MTAVLAAATGSTTDWVVLELSPKGEGEDPDIIRKSIRHIIRDAEVFIPAATTKVNDDKVVHYLVEGYAFVRRKHADQAYFRLENTKFVQSVLCKPGSRILAVIPDKDIFRMQRQVAKEVHQGIAKGDTVMITTGAYRLIEALVIGDTGDLVQVEVTLRSKQTILSIPRSGLRPIRSSSMSKWHVKVDDLREWGKSCKKVLAWSSGPLTEIQKSLAKLQEIQQLRVRKARLEGQLISLTPLKRALQQFDALDVFLTRKTQLDKLIEFGNTGIVPGHAEAVSRIAKTMGDLSRWHLLTGRLQESYNRAVTGVTGTVSKSPENLIIDGLNLVYRNLYAPNLKDLCDSKGRATGVLYGFLRSVQSFRRLFPQVQITVAWDGSSAKRKALFSEYKANRSHHSFPTEQVTVLKQVLPLVGVWQAHNPDEEADDVIATLVRNQFKGQDNRILSKDHDFFQLVSDTTKVYLPGSGNRHTIECDPAEVVTTFGTTPDKVLQLRALLGDTSDNIPGVPRVAKSVLRKLINTYNSVEGVYASGLNSLTRSQYDKLRQFEPQAKLNLELMALRTVEVSIVPPDVSQDTAVKLLSDYDIQSPLVQSIVNPASLDNSTVFETDHLLEY